MRGAAVCIALVMLVVGAVWWDDPADDGWQWFDLERRELGPSAWRAQGDHGEDYASLRPSDTAPAGLGKLFPEAIWYVGIVHLPMEEPIAAAVRTYEGRWYTEQWLYVDTDADGRLDDERKLEGILQPTIEIEPGIVQWPTFGWPAVTATVVSREGDRRQLEIHPTGYMLGRDYDVIILNPILKYDYVATGAIGGQHFELHLVDYDGDGRLSAEYWSEDRAILRLPTSGEPPAMWKAPKLRARLGIGSEFLKLQVDADRPAVGFKPYDEPTNTFLLSATDGRGRPMQIALMRVCPLRGDPIVYWAPASSIRIPVREDAFWFKLGLPCMTYELCYADRPDVRYGFSASLDRDMFIAQHEPAELRLGGPLRIKPGLTVRESEGQVSLQGCAGRSTLEDHGLTSASREAGLKSQAWIIGPDGNVVSRHSAEPPRMGPNIAAKLGANALRGRYSLNVVLDPGEYQEPLRATAHCEF